MGLFQDRLIPPARVLVSAAMMNGVDSYIPVLDKFPFVRSIEERQWDFTFAVAGVFVALNSLLELDVGRGRFLKIWQPVEESFAAWDARGMMGVEHCREFVARNVAFMQGNGFEARFIGVDALGWWMAWEFLEHGPEGEEQVRFARALGSLVLPEFSHYWDKGGLGEVIASMPKG